MIQKFLNKSLRVLRVLLEAPIQWPMKWKKWVQYIALGLHALDAGTENKGTKDGRDEQKGGVYDQNE